MNKFKILIPLTAVSMLSFIYLNSCDDAGINPDDLPRPGIISLTQSKMQTLDPTVQGSYQLWVIIDTSSGGFLKKLGTFNIGSNGTIVDGAGNPAVFDLGPDTVLLPFFQSCFISVGFDSDNDVNPHILAGTFAQYDDSLGVTLVMDDPNAVGPAITPILADAENYRLINYQPTGNNTNCRSGVWFCDTLGNSLLPDLGTLSTSSRWLYQGWVVDTTLPPASRQYLSTGQFYDPRAADLDGAGPCAGTLGGAFNKPGQDWYSSAGGCPGMFNINDNRHQVFITLEPYNEGSSAQTKPFYVMLLRQLLISPSTACGVTVPLGNMLRYGLLPLKAHLHITK